MQVLNLKDDQAYSNFVNSINSEQTREMYEYCLRQFLKYCQMDLYCFLSLSQQEISNILINYLVEEKKKISRQYLAIEQKHDKLLTSLRTAYTEELNLKKEQTSYDDMLDALRLSLKGYNIQ